MPTASAVHSRTGGDAGRPDRKARQLYPGLRRTFSADPDTALLHDLAGHVASGSLGPVESSVFPLADIASAQEAFSRGGILGKLVIDVAA